MKEFKIILHDNGVELISFNLGYKTVLFLDSQAEQFLTAIYQKCFDYKIGDKVKIEEAKND